MAAPAYQSIGTISGSVTTLTPGLPSSYAADDILLLFIMTANETISLTTANGWALITGLDNGGGVAANNLASRLAVYWKRATSGSETAPLIADAGNAVQAVTMAVRGCITTGDPWDVVAGDAETAATDAVAIPGTTTTVADCLVVLACADGHDSAASRLATITNGDLASITSRFDSGEITGSGNGVSIFTAGKAAIGAYGTSTGTNTIGASRQGRATIALKPPVVGGFLPQYARNSNTVIRA